MADLKERTRPAIWGPVLIAACFLAIIGGSAGWALGQRAEAREQRLTEEANRQEFPLADVERPAPQDEQVAPQGERSADDPRGEPAEGCPAHTQELAGGHLTLLLYLRTAGSEVWICADGNGALFYQGHRGGAGEDLVEGTNALFLTSVEKTDGGYAATNKTGRGVTVYRVSEQRLVIEDEHGGKTVEPAVN